MSQIDSFHAKYTAPDPQVQIKVTVAATSVKDSSKSATFTITVNPLPAITATITATISQPCPILATGGTPPYSLHLTSGSLPAWTSFNTTTGAICSGSVPNNATTASFSATLSDSVNGSSGPNPVAVSITVPIKITTASPLATGEVSQANYNTGALAFIGGSGAPAAANPWSVTSGGAALTAAGLTFNQSTGAITGPPTAPCGPCSFTVQVTDSLGATGSQAFTLTINPKLTITSSGALPSGTLNAAYTPVTLQATGGTAPLGNWSKASGSLPTGLSLSTAGVISGTPGCPAGHFTFTAQLGPDADGVTAISNQLSITINSPALAITTTSLPNATVGTAYDQAIQTSGGDCTAITFALANGTSLPAWASLNTSTGHITGTPAPSNVGTSNPFQISATQAGTTVTSGNLTITVAATGANSGLNGHYAFMLRGFDPGGNRVAMAGSFTADGAGNVTGGVMDVNAASNGVFPDLTITPAPISSYSMGADNRGRLTLVTSAGTWSFDFALGGFSSGVASLGHIIIRLTASTNGSAISGVLKKQDTSAFTLTAFNGDFAFLNEGWDGTGGRVAQVGRFTMSSGNISNGVFDINDNGTVDGGTAGPVSFGGSLGSVDTTNGRAPETSTIASTTSHSAVYIVSGNEAFLINIDGAGSQLLSGSVLRQSTTFCSTAGSCNFSHNALNGTAVVYTQSNSGPSGVASCSAAGVSTVQAGVFTFTPGAPTGNFSGGADANACGTIFTPSTNPVSGTYNVAGDGRVTTTQTGINHPPILYLVDTNRVFLIGTNGGRVEAGVVEPQVGPIAFSSHNDAFGTLAPAVAGETIFDSVQTVTATSATNVNITNVDGDFNSIAGGLLENVSKPNYSITNLDQTTGRFTFNFPISSTTSSPRVGYFINSSRRVVINVDPTVPVPWILIDDNQ